MDELSHISTYPVGLLADIKHRKIAYGMKYLLLKVKRRDWRAVRNYFNGYLAEWHYPPQGVTLYMCGRGWTRKAALRELGRRIIQANTPELGKA